MRLAHGEKLSAGRNIVLIDPADINNVVFGVSIRQFHFAGFRIDEGERLRHRVRPFRARQHGRPVAAWRERDHAQLAVRINGRDCPAAAYVKNFNPGLHEPIINTRRRLQVDGKPAIGGREGQRRRMGTGCQSCRSLVA